MTTIDRIYSPSLQSSFPLTVNAGRTATAQFPFVATSSEKFFCSASPPTFLPVWNFSLNQRYLQLPVLTNDLILSAKSRDSDNVKKNQPSLTDLKSAISAISLASGVKPVAGFTDLHADAAAVGRRGVRQMPSTFSIDAILKRNDTSLSSGSNSTQRPDNKEAHVISDESKAELDSQSHPTSGGKRRSFYTRWQLDRLETAFLFDVGHYPNQQQRNALAARLNVSESRIQIWFQNRRAKWRKSENTRRRPGRPGENRRRMTCSGEPIPVDELRRREERLRQRRERRRHQRRLRCLELVGHTIPEVSVRAAEEAAGVFDQLLPPYSNLIDADSLDSDDDTGGSTSSQNFRLQEQTTLSCSMSDRCRSQSPEFTCFSRQTSDNSRKENSINAEGARTAEDDNLGDVHCKPNWNRVDSLRSFLGPKGCHQLSGNGKGDIIAEENVDEFAFLRARPVRHTPFSIEQLLDF